MPDERRTIPLDDLIPAPFNPKHKIHGQYRDGLIASLDHFGIRDELKTWPDPEQPGKYYVLDGNQRLDVLREKGVTEVECRVLADLSPEDAKLFTAAFDRNHAEYDELKLAALAADLKSKGASLVASLLRPDSSLVAPPPRVETATIEATHEELRTIPVMFMLSPQGHDAAKRFLLKSKARLKQEERLLGLLQGLSERDADDLMVDLAIQIGATKTVD